VKHPELKTLLGFARGALRESKVAALYAHLSACGACSDRYLALRSLAASFDSEWESWMERVAGAAPPEAPISTVRVAGDLAVAARVIVSGLRGYAGIASKALASWMEEASDFSLRLEPAWLGTGAPDGGLPAGVEAAATLLAAGRVDEAEQALSDAAATSPAHVVTATALAQSARAGIEVRMHVESHRRTLSLLLRGGEAARAHVWTATLLREDGAFIGEAGFAAVPGADYLLARLIAPEDGNFVVGVRRD
jgi:hypothetical protein